MVYWNHLSVCPDNIFWTAQPFVAKLGMVMHHQVTKSWSIMSKEWFAIFKVTVRARMFRLYLLFLLKKRTLLQPECDDTSLGAGVLWKDWMAVCKFKFTAKVQIVSVRLENIISMAEPFATKLGMLIQHHELNIMWRDWFAIFKVKLTVRAHNI